MPVRVDKGSSGGGCGDDSDGMMLSIMVNIVILIMVAMVTMVMEW